jgi:eukaryotic-like serine/threonine-protein kinase
MLGKTVGKYRIVDRLGRGGMGTVYKAVDETLEREVAIKVLNSDIGESDVLKRFRAEAVTLARLSHQGIATLYELHRHDDELLMVMEFVRGETFHDLSERLGPMAPPQAAQLCVQALDALAHAHRAGVVHRDLKPANLMVTESGTVKVMDFGIARVLGTEHYTQSGYMMGTPAYMAPEQVLGRDVDGRADLYAIGVVLYRLLAAQLPFEADTAIAMVQKQLSDAPTPVARIRPDLPEWCSHIVERALLKDPAERFQTAEEFRAALMNATHLESLSDLPTMATPTPPGLLRDPDMTMAHEGALSRATAASARTRQSAAGAAVATPPAVAAKATGAARASTAPRAAVSHSVERTTGTTVVLGGKHLAGIAAMFVVLAAGIGILGFAALRRGTFQQQLPLLGTQPHLATDASSSSSTPTTPPASADGQAGGGQAPETPATAADGTATPPPGPGAVAATAGATPVQPVGSVPTTPATPTATPKPNARATAPATPPAPPPVETAATTAKSPVAKSAAIEPPPPAVPASTASAASVSFEGVRVLVSDGGDRARERQGVLQLGGGRLTIVDRAGGNPIAALPYNSIAGAFYSRSKQPRWKDANGKDVESRADLGRMGFFRGERNWVIFLSNSEPLIIRLEDDDLKSVLPAIQEQTGIAIKR